MNLLGISTTTHHPCKRKYGELLSFFIRRKRGSLNFELQQTNLLMLSNLKIVLLYKKFTVTSFGKDNFFPIRRFCTVNLMERPDNYTNLRDNINRFHSWGLILCNSPY